MKTIIIGSKSESYYAKIKYNCDYVISIQDFLDEPVATPPGVNPENHKRFFFDDLTDKVPSRYSSRNGDILRDHPPDEKDVQGILAQFRSIPDWSRIYIHCWAGVSRSTAMAYMCYCDQYPVGEEEGAMRLVENNSISSAIWPNELIVEMADKELGRNGRMIQAVIDWKEAEKALSIEEAMDKRSESAVYRESLKSGDLGQMWETQQEQLKVDKKPDTE